MSINLISLQDLKTKASYVDNEIEAITRSLQSLSNTSSSYCDLTEYLNNLKNTQKTLSAFVLEQNQSLNRSKREVSENEKMMQEFSEFLDDVESENASKLIDTSKNPNSVDEVINDLKSSGQPNDSLIVSTAIVEDLLNRSLPKLL